MKRLVGRRDRKEKEIITEERKDASVHRAFSLLDLQNEEPEPISWVAEGPIPSRLALLYGPSKTGKSRLALELAIDVSEGKNFLGFDCQDYKPRTEVDAQPFSQEVIESYGRGAMRIIAKLWRNPEIRKEIKEYAKAHPYHRQTEMDNVHLVK